MSGRREKRKVTSEDDSPSPTKKQNLASNKAKKEKKEKTKQTTPPQQTSTSSPLKTPKTPGSASRRGLKKETAKSLLKHGSKISPLYDMLHGFARLVLAKKPTTDEEFRALLDEFAGQLDPVSLDRKTFSNISIREYDAMCEELNLTAAGNIDFVESEILLDGITIPDSFKEQVRIVRKINVSKTEPGCRLNIGLYLANAVYLARKYLKAGKIVLFSEVPFEHEDLPGIGPIGGSLDYLTSSYAGVKGIGKGLNAQVRLKTPYLLVVEAKSGSIIGKDASLYQLIAQLITLEYHDTSDEGRWGCLTTGDQWDFYFLRKKVEQNSDGEDVITGYDLFDLTDVKIDGEKGMRTVMGILVHLVGQFRPSSTDIVKLDKTIEDPDW